MSAWLWHSKILIHFVTAACLSASKTGFKAGSTSCGLRGNDATKPANHSSCSVRTRCTQVKPEAGLTLSLLSGPSMETSSISSPMLSSLLERSDRWLEQRKCIKPTSTCVWGHADKRSLQGCFICDVYEAFCQLVYTIQYTVKKPVSGPLWRGTTFIQSINVWLLKWNRALWTSEQNTRWAPWANELVNISLTDRELQQADSVSSPKSL